MGQMFQLHAMKRKKNGCAAKENQVLVVQTSKFIRNKTVVVGRQAEKIQNFLGYIDVS